MWALFKKLTDIWTEARAAKLDNLDGLTPARAGYLDILNPNAIVGGVRLASSRFFIAGISPAPANTYNTVLNISGKGFISGVLTSSTGSGTRKVRITVDGGQAIDSGDIGPGNSLQYFPLFIRFNTKALIEGSAGASGNIVVLGSLEI